MKRFWWVIALAVVMTVVIADPALASDTKTDAGLPWEGGLETIRKSISGPVAFSIGLFCIIGIGCTLAFGGDMNGWLRGAIIMILTLAFIVSAPSMLKLLYSEAATIANAPPLHSLPLFC